jgi:hypothetical protein
MADPLSVFRQDLDLVKGELERFARYYSSVRYTYYHSEPFAPVPDEVWQLLAREHDDFCWEQLDVAPDAASCLWWDKETLHDVKDFRRVCNQCRQEIWGHAKLLASLTEIRDIVATDLGHHSWIRLIHRTMELQHAILLPIDKFVIFSARPIVEKWPDWSEIPEAQQRLVQELLQQNKAVPDIWFEHVRRKNTVAQFHADMLEVLYSRVQTSFVVELLGKLTTIQRNLVKTLGKQQLTTEALVEELNNRTKSDYRASGQIKEALAVLVKWNIMENEGKGYKNDTLGLRILAALS